MNVFDPIIKNLGIDWKIFLAQLVNFGIVFFVLKKFAFSPIQKLLKERQSKIEKGLNDATRSASELSMAK